MPAAKRTTSTPAKAFATTFSKEPALAFLSIIEQAQSPLRAVDIKAAAVAAGAPKSIVDTKWTSAQPLIKAHPWVRLDKLRYGWRAEPVAAADALATLVAKPARPLPQWLRDALGAIVAASLAAPASPKSSAAGGDGSDRAIRAAQERQWKIDVVRAVAELAMEAEEIAFKGADAELIVERMQTRTALHDLRPIGQAGGQVAFDPERHTPLAGDPAVGSSMFVIRPGYTWHARNEDVLIERAVVSTT